MDDTRCLKAVDRFGVDDALTTLLVFQEFTPESLDEYPQPVASVAKEQLDLGWFYYLTSLIFRHDFGLKILPELYRVTHPNG